MLRLEYLIECLIAFLFGMAAVSFGIHIVTKIKTWKHQRFIKANPSFLYDPNKIIRRNFIYQLDQSRHNVSLCPKYNQKIDLNNFEYEIQNLLALHFGVQHELVFYRGGKKYKIVFDDTERMIQEVTD